MSRIVPIISIALLLLLILGGVFLWWPKYEEFRNLKQELAIKTKELQQKQEFFNKLNELVQKLEGYKEQLAKIDTVISPKPDFSSLLYFLQRVANEKGVILTSLKFQKSSPLKIKKVVTVGEVSEIKEEETGIQENFFDFNITGTYPAFRNFLSDLENSARLIEVENISLSAATPDEEETEIKSFEFKIKVYSL